MITLGWARNHINSQTGRVNRIFRRVAEEKLIAGDLYQALYAA